MTKQELLNRLRKKAKKIGEREIFSSNKLPYLRGITKNTLIELNSILDQIMTEENKK